MEGAGYREGELAAGEVVEDVGGVRRPPLEEGQFGCPGCPCCWWCCFWSEVAISASDHNLGLTVGFWGAPEEGLLSRQGDDLLVLIVLILTRLRAKSSRWLWSWWRWWRWWWWWWWLRSGASTPVRGDDVTDIGESWARLSWFCSSPSSSHLSPARSEPSSPPRQLTFSPSDSAEHEWSVRMSTCKLIPKTQGEMWN